MKNLFEKQQICVHLDGSTRQENVLENVDCVVWAGVDDKEMFYALLALSNCLVMSKEWKSALHENVLNISNR